MEHEPYQHKPETIWNWNDTKNRLTLQYENAEKEFNEKEPTLQTTKGLAFENRMFFGRALDEIKDLKEKLHTWQAVENFVWEKIKKAGHEKNHQNETEPSKALHFENEEHFWMNFFEQIFQKTYTPRNKSK